jgi:hypothetical protein
MPRRAILSANDQAGLLALPDNQDGLICYYTFNEQDFSFIRQRRGDANRLGVRHSIMFAQVSRICPNG